MGQISDAPQSIVSGTIDLPEISGAVLLGDRLIVAADDSVDDKDPVKRFLMIAGISNAHARLSGGAIAIKGDEQLYANILKAIGPDHADQSSFVTDLEDLAISPDGAIYLISSHSKSRSSTSPLPSAKRRHLLRLRMDPVSGAIQEVKVAAADLLASLPEPLKTSTGRKPADVNPGFNIEGLAWAPGGDLLLGLRSPTRDSKALVLRIKDADQLFDHPEKPLNLAEDASLDLGGMGIRGMNYDAKRSGYWLIAGESIDPDEPLSSMKNDWSIWFWDGKNAPLKRLSKTAEFDGIKAPEAICPIEAGGPVKEASLLIIGDDGSEKPGSPFCLIPIAKLK